MMRNIAILKECTKREQQLLHSALQPEDRIFWFDSEQAMLASSDLPEIDIVFGEPAPDTLQAMKGLRWVQMTWAGANKYTSPGAFPQDKTLTGASGAFGGVISEHILSGVLCLYKNLRRYRDQLQQGQWQLLTGDDTLEGKRALILGTGNIGSETAKKLKAFGAYTVGICRTGRKKPDCFDLCYTADYLDEQLPQADLVIVSLPGTQATKGMLSAERICKMKSGAVLVNVGRGFVVDTQALTDALTQGRLRGAVLDVTDPEPLPAEHPLRFMEQVILTPHVSGISWGENAITREKIIRIFMENLQADAAGLPLYNQINLQQGY